MLRHSCTTHGLLKMKSFTKMAMMALPFLASSAPMSTLCSPLVQIQPTSHLVYSSDFSKSYCAPTCTIYKRTQTNMSTAVQPELMKRAEVIEPRSEHKFSVIFLHGLGDEGASFIDVFEMLSLPNTRVILPNAPIQPVTCNGGYKMPAWYDIFELGPGRKLDDKQDERGIMDSSDKLMALIDAEAAKVGYKRVFIGGFSQGSAMSMLTALRCPHELGGVVAASGYALLGNKANELVKTKTTPMLVYHGMDDQVVPLQYSRATQQLFKSHGVNNIEYFEEPRLSHSLSQQEIMKFKQFFTKYMQ